MKDVTEVCFPTPYTKVVTRFKLLIGSYMGWREKLK